MSNRGLSGGQYRPLSEDQIRTIHEASLTILEKTGFTYMSGLEQTIEMLAKAGARVDHGLARVFFPRDLVMAEVGKAPEQVILYSRDGHNDLDLGEDRVYLGTGGAAPKVLDPETGQARPSTLEDLYRFGLLVDQLRNIHFFLRPCIPTDIPVSAYDVNVFYACLKSTAKHVMIGVNDPHGFHEVLDMASLVAGSLVELQRRPFMSIVSCFAISPLRFCTQSTSIMQEACRYFIPVALSSAPLTGSTSPITMAGTLALAHAEQLAGITVCQLTRPGAPLLYGGLPGTANLRTMGLQCGSVEMGMMNAAIHQLAQHIKVPNYANAGYSDAKVPDAQAAWEATMSAVLAGMGGSNYIHHAAGMLDSALTVCLEQFVMNDEIIGKTCKILKGIEVDPEHLAVEVIDAVGPGGNFMTSPHTLSYLYTELFQGNGVTDSSTRDKWEKSGSLDAWKRARQIAENLIANARQSHLREDVDRTIRKRFDILLSQERSGGKDR
ncbi:MAG: trimethylamine methyltransferase family protein [Thermodesulfobacteriota bacterium]|nr:trimethylamine methyltransferase family protein [Thermodesulfobacteriota bacterium]